MKVGSYLLLSTSIRNKDPIHREIFYVSKESGDSFVEVALQYNDGYIDNTFLSPTISTPRKAEPTLQVSVQP